MRIVGVIAEFNPFHLGHARLFDEIRAAGAEYIAVVMSGNFVQRGEAAILSKTARVKQTLLYPGGADIVVELPLPWAAAGAEKFAAGGVFLLDSLGADTLCFGSECGSAVSLCGTAEALLSPGLRTALQSGLASGATFAKAREQAVRELAGLEAAELLSCPNDILGVEYCKAILSQGSRMKPYPIRRTGPAHDAPSPSMGIASASHVRSLLLHGEDISPFLPEAALEILREELGAGRAPASLVLAERALLMRLRMMDKKEFSSLPDLSEGLENRLRAASRTAVSLEGLYAAVKTKRYPLARIRRLVLSAFLGMTGELAHGLPPYLRILGMTAHGREILRLSKTTTKVPIIANSSDILSLDNHAASVVELECRGFDVFSLCIPRPIPCGADRTAGIIRL